MMKCNKDIKLKVKALTTSILVVSIEVFLSHFFHFRTMEYVFKMLKLSANDVIVSQKRFQWIAKVSILWAGLFFS